MFRCLHNIASRIPCPFHPFAIAVGIVLLLGTSARAAGAGADWTLLNADLREQPHLTVNTWTPSEGLSATDESGKLITVASRDIVTLRSSRQTVPDSSSRHWRLDLRNGDALYGEAAAISGQSLVFKIPELGSLAVPLKNVSALNAPLPAGAAGGVHDGAAESAAVAPFNTISEKDVVRFKNGDRLEGLVVAIDDTQLQISTEGAEKPANVALADVHAVSFGGVSPPRTVPPLSIRLTFVSGSTLTVSLYSRQNGFAWTLSSLTLKDPAGQDRTTSADQLISAEVRGGRVVYLTDLDPVSEEQSGFTATRWPAQANRNVLGQPLRAAGTVYARGIGVHTRSTLVYELDGSFDTLSLRVGMDDSAAPYGEAHAYIVLDGKTLWEAPSLKPGTLSAELALPIRGGKRLELHADPADHLDVRGRLDWINAALHRQ